MENKIYLNGQFGFREDTLENWVSENPVLERGEPAVIRDGGDGEWLKIGDGITAFNDLPYKKGPRGEKGETGPQGPQGEQGVKGEQGEKGADGKDAVTDLHYNPESENAQSGIAVAEAVSYKADKIVNSASGENILLTDSSNYAIEGLKVYGKSTQEGTPTPEAPIPIVSAGASGSVEVKVCGANLFNPYGITDIHQKEITTEVIDNGKSIKCSGALKPWSQCNSIDFYLVAGQTYTIAFDNITNTGTVVSGVILMQGNNVVRQMNNNQKSYTFTANKDAYKIRFLVNGTADTLTEPVIATYEGLRIVAGDTVVPWEEYKEPQTLTLATPNELRAVGDYKDYIDLERGVFVQNIYRATEKDFSAVLFSGTGAIALIAKTVPLPIKTQNGALTNISKHYMASWDATASAHHFTQTAGQILVIVLPNTYTTVEQGQEVLNNGIEFIYPLAEPIETPLTTEELAYYKALHTNYPNTTIFNSDGTNMDVSYIADTKLYIDNKFAELQALALEG